MPAPSPVDVIVLAGDRGPHDPLATQADVAGKTLVEVGGRPMLLRVLETLSAWSGLGRLIVVAPDTPDHRAVVDSVAMASERLLRVEPEASPSRSVAAALDACQGRRPVLLVTADHPLLDTAWLERLLTVDPSADLAVALVEYQTVIKRFPGSRRTRYRFSDVSICGTNLFAFQTTRADAVVRLWQRIEQQRKRPWRIVSMLGWSVMARYLARRLSLNEALCALSDKAGASISACVLDDPLSAVDVDSPADLELVERVLSTRSLPCS